MGGATTTKEASEDWLTPKRPGLVDTFAFLASRTAEGETASVSSTSREEWSNVELSNPFSFPRWQESWSELEYNKFPR